VFCKVEKIILHEKRHFCFDGDTHHGRWLEPVGQDDVRVHGSHVKMIDDRILQSERVYFKN
jgi:hypothetical protein